MRSRSAASSAFSQPCSMWMRLHRPCKPSRPCLASQGLSLPSVLDLLLQRLERFHAGRQVGLLVALAVDGLLPGAALLVELRHLLLQLVQAGVGRLGRFLGRGQLGLQVGAGAPRPARPARCGRRPAARAAGSTGATVPRCCAGRPPAPGSAAAPAPPACAARWSGPAPGAGLPPGRAVAGPGPRPGPPAAPPVPRPPRPARPASRSRPAASSLRVAHWAVCSFSCARRCSTRWRPSTTKRISASSRPTSALAS